MASNYIQPGDTLTLTAPYTVAAGAGALVGTIFGVAKSDVTSGASGEFATEGVWSLAKATGTGWSAGDAIYWDNSAKKCTKTAAGNTLIGVALETEASGDTTGKVRLAPLYATLGEAAQAANVVTLTDNTGGSGTHDDTLADGLTTVAASAQTSAAVTGTLTGTTDGAMADVAAIAISTSGGNTYSDADVNNAVNTAITAINLQLKELQVALNEAIADITAIYTFMGTVLTDLTVQNQNDSDIAQKVIEEIAALKTATLQASS